MGVNIGMKEGYENSTKVNNLFESLADLNITHNDDKEWYIRYDYDNKKWELMETWKKYRW